MSAFVTARIASFFAAAAMTVAMLAGTNGLAHASANAAQAQAEQVAQAVVAPTAA
jgi:hypothetical protein